MRTRFLLVAINCMLLLSACSGGPLVTIPGAALSGSVVAAPDDWAALAAQDTIQVEFRPADPYSINIWGAGIGRDLYIATGADGTRWTVFIDADPRVRVRIGESLFELQAVRVSDTAEHARVVSAYEKKYELDVGDNWVTDGQVYRMDRRQ